MAKRKGCAPKTRSNQVIDWFTACFERAAQSAGLVDPVERAEMRSFIEKRNGPMTDQEFDDLVDTRFTKPVDFLKDVRQQMFSELSQRAESITRYQFQLWIQDWIERLMNDGNDDWLVLSMEVKDAENITDIWPETHVTPFPKLKVAVSYKRRSLPDDFVQVGGKPKWIQGDETPLCPSCDSFMALLTQLSSLSVIRKNKPSPVDVYALGDAANVYQFCCPACLKFETVVQNY